MSQKKVDKYKNNKYSRNSALKKERAEFVLEMAAWILIAVLLVGWIGYSAYAKIQAKEASVKVDLPVMSPRGYGESGELNGADRLAEHIEDIPQLVI